MSCGNPHEVPCNEVLDRVYEYLDNEIPDAEACERIRLHLDECGPCLEKYGLDKAVKALVQRSCGSDDVPSDLREKVRIKIQLLRVEIESDTL